MKKVLMLIACIFSLSNAYAAETCTGDISHISISQAGSLIASIRNSSDSSVRLTDVVFCNLGSSSGNFAGESCKGMMSLLLAGDAMDKTATLYFNDAPFNSCTESWKNLSDIGFYHFKLN